MTADGYNLISSLQLYFISLFFKLKTYLFDLVVVL